MKPARKRPLLNAAPALVKKALVERARAEGFDIIGITTPKAPDIQGRNLMAYLEAGCHGSMAWMEERAQWRADPATLWPGAQSAIVLGLNYGPDHDPRGNLEARSSGNISVYARGDDYHDIIKPRLKAIGRWLAEETGAALKVFVDTAPVMEKPLAARAGLGWQGKHTNLVSREFGSWLFLGVILTTLPLPLDAPERDHCGSCTACLNACPTDAFLGPYKINGSRCISYLTIEHKGPIAPEFRAAIGNRIYGCDDCLAACPWNKFAVAGQHVRLQARDNLNNPSLAHLVQLDDDAFRALFAKNPVKRIGRERFLRNVLIAIGNSGDMSLLPYVIAKLNDASPLLRGAAIWALSRLAPEEAMRRAAFASDAAEDVMAEWHALRPQSASQYPAAVTGDGRHP